MSRTNIHTASLRLSKQDRINYNAFEVYRTTKRPKHWKKRKNANGYPTTIAKAIASEDSEHWIASMEDEDQNMKNFDACEEVEEREIPPNTKIIDSMWVYTRKSDGQYKSRCCLKGFQQMRRIWILEIVETG